MKIRTRLRINGIVTIILIVMVSLTFLLTDTQMTEIRQGKKIVDQIVKGVTELNILTHDYLLYREERTQIQWQKRYKSLTKLLDGEFHIQEVKIILEKLYHDHTYINTVLGELILRYNKREKPPEKEYGSFKNMENRIIGQLLVRSQSMVSSAFQLYNLFNAELTILEQRARMLIFVFFIILILLLTTTSIWIYRDVAIPITNLEKGSRIIGDGNLDHRVGTKVNDEVGQLSRAFDQMTENLSKILVSKDYVDSILKSMVEMIIVVDRDATIETVNPETLDLLGYEEQELVGNPIELILKKEEAQDLFHGTGLSVLINKGAIKGIERTFQTKDGRKIPVLLSGSVMFDEKNKIKRIVCIGQDITERKQAEEQIAADLKEKETLLQEIHHRVKNNMLVISSLLGLQMESVTDNKTKEVLQDSQNRLQTMSMIHETLYRSENLSSIDMKTYLSDLGSVLLQGYAVSSKVNLKIDVENIMFGVIQATSLGLIINELITNSLKYAFPDEREGEIMLKLKLNRENEVELTVSDNGIGIPEGFNFQDADSLGLKLVKIISEDQLKGSVVIENQNGTKFIVTFNVNAA